MINRTDYQDGGVLFYRIFVSELAGLGNIEFSPEGDVRQAFRQIRVVAGVDEPTYDQLRIIGDYLGADIMLSGTILEMKEVTQEKEVIPYITVRLDVLDAVSGNRLWSIYYRRNGSQYRQVMHFGVIGSITQLAKQISKEIIISSFSKGFTEKCIK